MTFYIARYYKQEKIDFTIKFITPAFIGGADQSAELRSSSIKGLLRFWWRVLHPGREKEALLREESEIFGDAGDKGKSNIIIHVSNQQNITPKKHNLPNHPIQVTSKGRTFPVNIIDYLAFGISEGVDRVNIMNRNYIPPEGEFLLHIFGKENYTKEAIRALSALYQFGGIGAKSRNGFGNFECASSLLQNKIQTNNKSISNYTSLSGGSQFHIGTFSAWDKALAEVGKVYRSANLKLEPRHKFARRELIRAPIIEQKQQVSKLDRHAKPYFLHISKVNDNQYDGDIFFIPYHFGENCSSKWNDKSRLYQDYQKTCEDMNSNINNIISEHKRSL